MSGADFHLEVREFLRDTAYGRSNASPRYPPPQIKRVAEFARMKVYDFLVSRVEISDFARSDFSDRPGRLTIRNMIRVCNASDSDSVPADFFRLIAGLSATGKYVPAFDIAHGEWLSKQGEQAVYVKNGLFYGTALTAAYYGRPGVPISDDATDLTAVEMNDAFYDTVAIFTAKELMHGEKRLGARAIVLDNLFKRELASLQ